MDEYESLSHSKWECKYHVVFIPKGRRKVQVQEPAPAFGRSVPQAGRAEREPDRRRPSANRPCAHDDFDSTQVCGLASGGVYQGQERNPSGPSIRRTEAELRRAELLGARIFRIDGRAR